MDSHAGPAPLAPASATRPASPPSPMVAEMRRNLWWSVAALGIALVLLARTILFLDDIGDGRDGVAAGFFALIGAIAIVAGLTLAALLQPVMGWGARVALLLGAAFIALGMTSFL